MIYDKQIRFDPRVYMTLFVAELFLTLMVHSNIGLTLLFIIALVWQILAGCGSNVIGFAFSYAILWAITKLSILWLITNPAASIAITLSNIGLMGRKAIVPFLFVLIITKLSTGSLIASLGIMGIPKIIGIGFATMLRFFPTLAEEYRCIRNAQKFRGIGIGFWSTLFQLPQVTYYVLIPLIIRITKISEELSASVTVRGVRFKGETISYRPIKFREKDVLYLVMTLALLVTILLLDNFCLGVYL